MSGQDAFDVTITPPDWPNRRPGDEIGIRLLGQRRRSMIVESVEGATLTLRPRTWRDLPRILVARLRRLARFSGSRRLR